MVSTIPLPSLATAAATNNSAGPLYSWAVAIARAQNRASPMLLARQLRISQASASQLYASLIANGVIRAPVFGGMARAADPLFRGAKMRVVEAQLSKSANLRLTEMKPAVDQLVEEDAPEEGTSNTQAI